MKKLVISLIEDDRVIRNAVSGVLEQHADEFTVGGIYTDVEGFLDSHMARLHQGHVLLLDISLPGMSGVDAIPMILDKLPDIDIIMLTVYEEEELILKALSKGACSYISKRFGIGQIVGAIRVVAAGGAYMSPSIARAVASYFVHGRKAIGTLSNRQKEILQKLVEGKSYDTIACELFLSVETIRSHIKKMYKVLQVSNKAEAITQYLRGYVR